MDIVINGKRERFEITIRPKPRKLAALCACGLVRNMIQEALNAPPEVQRRVARRETYSPAIGSRTLRGIGTIRIKRAFIR